MPRLIKRSNEAIAICILKQKVNKKNAGRLWRLVTLASCPYLKVPSLADFTHQYTIYHIVNTLVLSRTTSTDSPSHITDTRGGTLVHSDPGVPINRRSPPQALPSTIPPLNLVI